MPSLAEHFTVVAVDLRGAGLSSKPNGSVGYDPSAMAGDIRGLMRHLGLGRTRIVGHDG